MSHDPICTWPSCKHTAKDQCRGAPRRIQLFTDDQRADLHAAAIARAERAEAALRAIAEGNLGDDPWQANYARIRETAIAALKESVEPTSTPRQEGGAA